MCRWLPGCLFGAKAAGSCRDEPGTTRPGIARELIATSRQGPRHPPSTLRPHAGHPHPDPAPWLGCRHVLRHLLGVPGKDKMRIWGHGGATWATGQRLCCAAATGRRPGEALGKGRAGSSSGARDSRSHHGSRCLGVWELNCLSVRPGAPPRPPGDGCRRVGLPGSCSQLCPCSWGEREEGRGGSEELSAPCPAVVRLGGIPSSLPPPAQPSGLAGHRHLRQLKIRCCSRAAPGAGSCGQRAGVRGYSQRAAGLFLAGQY